MNQAHPPVAITPYLLAGFDKPYDTIDGAPHFGPVHSVLAGESLTEHHMLQSHLRRTQPTDAYIGFGGWINLGYIAALRPQVSVLADINGLQALYWQFHLNAVAACKTKAGFSEAVPGIVEAVETYAGTLPGRLNGHLITKPGRPLHGSFRDDIHSWRHEGCDGYASSDDAYASVRDLVLQDRVSVALVDVKDESGMRALRHHIEARRGSVRHTTVHLSNILEFVKGDAEDWAGTDCGKYAFLEAKHNARTLAHGIDETKTGTIIYTKGHTKNGVRYTMDGEIDLHAAHDHCTVPVRRPPVSASRHDHSINAASPSHG